MLIDRSYQLLLSLPLKIFQQQSAFLLLDFLTLKDFQICSEDMDFFKTFNSGILRTIFVFFLKISSSVLKTYPVLLLSFLEDI